MTPADETKIRQLIDETIRQTAPVVTRETLVAFGFTVNDPTSLQQDMAHLRRLRVGSEHVKGVAVKTCLGALLSGLGWITWEGLKQYLRVRP